MSDLVSIKMLTCGPARNYRKGSTVEVDPLRAAYLIQHKHAEGVNDGPIRTEELRHVVALQELEDPASPDRR